MASSNGKGMVVDDAKREALGESALRCIEQKWRMGGVPYDPARLSSLYTDDALFYGGLAQLYAGREQIRAYFDYYVGLVASSVIALRDQNLIWLSDETVAAQGIVEFAFGLPDGRSTSLTQRSTLIVTRTDDADWLVRLQHFSVRPAETPVPV